MNYETIIVSVIGVLGTVFASFLNTNVTIKHTIMEKENNQIQNMMELISKYKEMCEDMENKIDKLELKVSELENENNQLRHILISHGIELITTNKEE